jgi:hypothetical protein
MNTSFCSVQIQNKHKSSLLRITIQCQCGWRAQSLVYFRPLDNIYVVVCGEPPIAGSNYGQMGFYRTRRIVLRSSLAAVRAFKSPCKVTMYSGCPPDNREMRSIYCFFNATVICWWWRATHWKVKARGATFWSPGERDRDANNGACNWAAFLSLKLLLIDLHRSANCRHLLTFCSFWRREVKTEHTYSVVFIDALWTWIFSIIENNVRFHHGGKI